MHELGVVFHIIDDLKAVAKANDVTSISKVTIELGEVSGVVEEYLTDCWKWASAKDELVKECEMEIEIILLSINIPSGDDITSHNYIKWHK